MNGISSSAFRFETVLVPILALYNFAWHTPPPTKVNKFGVFTSVDDTFVILCCIDDL